jgi:hypothetical protein
MIAGAASMGVRPSEFWAMTPYELAMFARGQTDKRHAEMETLAWVQSNLINVHLARGDRVTPGSLYSRPGAEAEEEREFASAEDFAEYMRTRNEE